MPLLWYTIQVYKYKHVHYSDSAVGQDMYVYASIIQVEDGLQGSYSKKPQQLVV